MRVTTVVTDHDTSVFANILSYSHVPELILLHISPCATAMTFTHALQKPRLANPTVNSAVISGHLRSWEV